jgi:hypothetical protein
MTDLERQLADALARMADEAPADPDLLGSVRAKAGRRWPSPRAVLAAGAAAAVVVAAGVVAAIGSTGDEAEPAASSSYNCPAALTSRTLPDWARTGFSDPEPEAIYVMGAKREILGVVFGNPLMYPPADDHQNKVLWVARSDSGPMNIEARLVPNTAPVVIESGTGPSILDLPAAGCWHLDLSWGGHTDSLNLLVGGTPSRAADDQGACSHSGGDTAIARREAVEWAGVVDHLVEVTVVGLEPGMAHSMNNEQMLVEVDRVWWSRPGATELPATLDLTVAGCSVGPLEQAGGPNWVPGQRYVVPVVLYPAGGDRPAPRWEPLSGGTAFAYDDGVLAVPSGLFLESTWAKQHVGEPADVLVTGLREAERDNADLLAQLADLPDPIARSAAVRAGEE